MNLEGLRPWGGLAGAALEEADVVVAGIPYDGSATYRKGAALAPERVRRLSAVMPPMTEDGRSLRELKVHDLGNLDPGPEIEHGWQGVAERLAALPTGAILTVVGGDHCAMIPVLAAQARRHPGLRLVWVDAHPDLCNFSRGGSWTCGCALRRGLEAAQLSPADLMLAGPRDFDPEEVDYASGQDLTRIWSAELARDPIAAGRRLGEVAGGHPLHISFDIDVLDPAFAPGTEIPSGGGISTRQALDFLAGLAEGSRLVGLDVAEVAPNLDQNDITSLAALKLIFEFWGRAWKPRM